MDKNSSFKVGAPGSNQILSGNATFTFFSAGPAILMKLKSRPSTLTGFSYHCRPYTLLGKILGCSIIDPLFSHLETRTSRPSRRENRVSRIKSRLSAYF